MLAVLLGACLLLYGVKPRRIAHQCILSLSLSLTRSRDMDEHRKFSKPRAPTCMDFSSVWMHECVLSLTKKRWPLVACFLRTKACALTLKTIYSIFTLLENVSAGPRSRASISLQMQMRCTIDFVLMSLPLFSANCCHACHLVAELRRQLASYTHFDFSATEPRSTYPIIQAFYALLSKESVHSLSS